MDNIRNTIIKSANQFPQMRLGAFLTRVINIEKEINPSITLYNIEDEQLAVACEEYVRLHTMNDE